MKNSKNSAVQRAFQSLPRNLRRRAASHNIKRLPVRLRNRAMREVEADPVKKGKKPDNRHKKRRVGTITQEYLRRQAAQGRTRYQKEQSDACTSARSTFHDTYISGRV
ncbi:hypothetical protein BGZ76_006454 [Entomortierella beljakovae]|nr:hypothetical protein BGZ76_006454 [Entomortierella beljakovae]